MSLWSGSTAKSIIRHFLFFFSLSLGLVVMPRLGDPFLSENLRGICESHSPRQILGCAYTICLWLIFQIFTPLPPNYFYTFPTKSCLVLYTFRSNWLYLLITWEFISCLSPYNQHLQCCCVVSIFALMCVFLMALLIIIIIIIVIRVFHISVSWWSFTGVLVTASLLKSPGLFSYFCPFSIM